MADPLLIVSRAEWGAESWQNNRTPIIIPATHRVGWVVHWPGAPQHLVNGHEVSCYAAVRAIQRYHKYSRGWSDGAYSFVLCPHGTAFELRGWLWDQFATSPETNGNHYTVCVLVDPDAEPTEVQMAALKALVAMGRDRGCGLMVQPHSSWQSTSCPGPFLRLWTAGLDAKPFDRPVLLPADEEDEVNAYVIYKDLRYANLWLVGGGGAVQLSPHLANHYLNVVKLTAIHDQHEQTLKSMLALSGLTTADLVAG